MIQAGDVIENPVTGERIRFLETAKETGGESGLPPLPWTGRR